MTDQKSLGDRIIARAGKHYLALGLRHVDIEEWGEDGQPLRLWFKPITVDERQDYLRESATRGGSQYGAVKCIITKALTAEGQKVFDLSHQHWLLTGVYGPIVERIAEAFMAVDLKPLPPREPGETPQEHLAKN